LYILHLSKNNYISAISESHNLKNENGHRLGNFT
jgi:hypothetical protein